MSVCEMRRFPFHWDHQISQIRRFVDDQYFSELKLDDEWKIVCDWKENPGNRFELQTINIYRQIAFEKISILGTLSYHRNAQTISTQVFSKLIESGYSSVIIYLSDPHLLSWEFSLPGSHILSGTVYIASSAEKYSGECKTCIHAKSLVRFSNDLKRLLDPQSSCFPDVNLKCEDTLIPAHKNILSARSPVFAAMFANEMKEKHEKQVAITDMDASVVRAMVTYIYTGKTSSLTVSSASDLLFAADKYQLEDLQRVSCDFLKEKVSLQNVLSLLVLGDLHDEDLKSCALDYICNKCANFSVIEETQEWKALRKEKPDLAMDVLTSLVKSRDQKSKEVQHADPVVPGVQTVSARGGTGRGSLRSRGCSQRNPHPSLLLRSNMDSLFYRNFSKS